MIPADRTSFRTSAASHAGKGATHNEDRSRIEAFLLSEDSAAESIFAVIADGIGTHSAGEVAAELAVDTITSVIAVSDASQPTGILEAAIIQASQTTLFRSESRPEWKGMGSTVLCAWVIGRKLYIASVGNSRIYLLRGRRLQQLNVTQRLAGKQPVVAPKKRGKTLANDPLLGYLGAKSPVDVDLRLITEPGREGQNARRNQGFRLQPNDRLLLCSDGLGDALDPKEILEFLGTRQADTAAGDLVQFALEKGTASNLTALVIVIPPGYPPLLKQPINWRRAFSSTFAIAFLIFLGLFSWWLWIGRLEPLTNPVATSINTLTPFPTNTPQP
jgi:serine/threonine protein phosphatase PrpC